MPLPQRVGTMGSGPFKVALWSCAFLLHYAFFFLIGGAGLQPNESVAFGYLDIRKPHETTASDKIGMTSASTWSVLRRRATCIPALHF